MRYLRSQPGRNRGLSLIELLIGTTLGFLLIGAVIAVYQASKRSYVESEQVAALAENSRFAEITINHALRHVGFFGASQAIDIERDPDLGLVINDCTGPGAAYDLDNFIFAVTNTDGTAFGCIDDALPNTDVLVVKRVRPQPLYDADPENALAARDGVISFPSGLRAERTYIIATHMNGLLLDGADTPPLVDATSNYRNGIAWEYELEIYYIRNTAVPQLSRKFLQWDGTGMSIATENMVEGVEQMRLLFGYDSTGNGEIDSYTNATGVTDWGAVHSIEAFLMVRSADQDLQFEDNRVYTLAGEDYTPGGNYRRLVVHSRVSMRNPKLRIRGGV